MNIISMSGSLRENVGKKDAGLLRKQGKVPCVLYGGEKQLHFSVEEKAFKKLVYTPEVNFVKLNINGEEFDAILQDIQFHKVTEHIMHADFLQLNPEKEIVMSLPVRITGTSKGVLKGGKLIKKYNRLKVKALPANMPSQVLIDITPLDINDSVRVSDIQLNNVRMLDNPGSVVVGVRSTRAVAESAEGEQASE